VLPSTKEGGNRGLETLWTDGATRFVRNEERRMARQTVCYHLPKKEGTVTWSMRRQMALHGLSVDREGGNVKKARVISG
jgi:hypothetical protein